VTWWCCSVLMFLKFWSRIDIFLRRLVNSECIRYIACAAVCRHDIFCTFSGENYIFFKALYYVGCLCVFFGALVSLWTLLVSIVHCGCTEQLNSIQVRYSHHYKDLISLHMSHVLSSAMSKKKYPEKCGTSLSVLHVSHSWPWINASLTVVTPNMLDSEVKALVCGCSGLCIFCALDSI
jgi:hypothetical protein